jgi:hypothetical protein
MKPLKKKNPKHDDNFESVGKRLGCDDDKTRFEARLGNLARVMPLTGLKR